MLPHTHQISLAPVSFLVTRGSAQVVSFEELIVRSISSLISLVIQGAGFLSIQKDLQGPIWNFHEERFKCYKLVIMGAEHLHNRPEDLRQRMPAEIDLW